MRYLTFLDYTSLETTGKNIELKLLEKEKEIAYLRERDSAKDGTIGALSDKVMKLTEEFQELKNSIRKK